MKNSNIDYIDDTINRWWGCKKNRVGCQNCYAIDLMKRYKYNPDLITPIKNWKRKATGRIILVGSMMDIFDKREEVNELRKELIDYIINDTGNTYLLLTKHYDQLIKPEFNIYYPDHVYLGVSISNNKDYKEFMNLHRHIKHRKLWVSFEPLVGKINIEDAYPFVYAVVGGERAALRKARRMDVSWVRKIVKVFQRTNTRIFVKQLGTSLAHENKVGNKDVSTFPEIYLQEKIND
jgi:protein gp37